jgi:hypothetical protein
MLTGYIISRASNLYCLLVLAAFIKLDNLFPHAGNLLLDILQHALTPSLARRFLLAGFIEVRSIELVSRWPIH